MPRIPFTPPTASINRVRIVDLPGLAIDESVCGKLAYHLLSAPVLAHMALEQASALGIPADLRHLHPDDPQIRQQVPRLVSQRFVSGTLTQQRTAAALAQRLGRNLGYIFLTVHRGDAVNRAAREEWTDADWAHWASIRHLWVGGGLMSSEFGTAIVDSANALLRETGYINSLTITRTPWAQHMGTLGGSRYLPLASRCALVLDLGQTSVKRAVVHLDSHGIQRMDQLPTTPVVWPWRNDPDAGKGLDPQAVLDYTADVIAEGYHLALRQHPNLERDIILCIAAYVRGGRLLGNGIYARMSLLGDDVRVLLSQALSRRGVLDAQIHVIHDGTAAAAVHAGEVNCAVWVIGTAIGVGFPEPDAGHLHRMPEVATPQTRR